MFLCADHTNIAATGLSEMEVNEDLETVINGLTLTASS